MTSSAQCSVHICFLTVSFPPLYTLAYLDALCSVEEFSCPLVVVGDLGEDERFEPEWLKCPRPSWGVGHWK